MVTGFDGSSFIQNFFPDLITVRQPTEEIAKLLCGLLIEKINHPSHHFDHEYVIEKKVIKEKNRYDHGRRNEDWCKLAGCGCGREREREYDRKDDCDCE